uniref:glycosyltransferase n=1 Tax=Gelidibacter sp. TaxID=2018083 RepID=UPI00404B7853
MTKLVKKVCLVTISLSKGGAERSTALLSKMLTEAGFEVHLVVLSNEISYDYSGKLLNLGQIEPTNNKFFSRIKRFNFFRNYLREQEFDYIIDNRNRQFAFKELYYILYIYKNFKIIYVVRSFKIEMYFPKNNWVAKQMISRATTIVGVSKAITNRLSELYNTEKAITIHNPIEPFNNLETVNTCNEKYIVFIGRLEDKTKNISLLLEGYELSNLRNENIRLRIIGDGKDKKLIEDKIKLLKITEYVDLIPFKPDVLQHLKNALYLVLTSHYEGFPRVLIEALSVGLPVISVDCKSGPNEIITNETNGLLVENYNPEALSCAMNQFIFDHNLYQKCKDNAKESIKHLNQSIIAKQWTKILK